MIGTSLPERSDAALRADVELPAMMGLHLLKAVFRRLGLVFFAILVVFWVATLFNCASGFFEGGLAGAHDALVRHSSQITIDQEGRLIFHKHSAARQYGFLGLLTLLLGYANRSPLSKLYLSFRQGLRTRFNAPN